MPFCYLVYFRSATMAAPVKESRAAKNKKWREENVKKVEAYYKKKIEKRIAFEATNPEAARELRKGKAALRKEQRRKQKIRKEQEEMEKENMAVEKENDPEKTVSEHQSVQEKVVQKMSRQKIVGLKRKRQNDDIRKEVITGKPSEGELTPQESGSGKKS